MKCKKHPKYQAIRKPTADCQPCRDMWHAKNNQKTMSAGDLSELDFSGDDDIILARLGRYAPCQCGRCSED